MSISLQIVQIFYQNLAHHTELKRRNPWSSCSARSVALIGIDSLFTVTMTKICAR